MIFDSIDKLKNVIHLFSPETPSVTVDPKSYYEK